MAKDKTPDHLDLDNALLAAQRELKGRISPDSKTDEYEYVSADKMIQVCRKHLLKHGILVRRIGLSMRPWESTDYITVISKFTVSGRRMIAEEEGDPGKHEEWFFIYESLARERYGLPIDKAVSAQATIAWSGFLRDLLLVPRFGGEEQLREQADVVSSPYAQQPTSPQQPETAASMDNWPERPTDGAARASRNRVSEGGSDRNGVDPPEGTAAS